MRWVQSTLGGGLYPAMIQLGRKIGSEQAPRTLVSWDRYVYAEAFPAMVVFCDVSVPASGDLPLVLEFIVGADQKVYNFDSGIGVVFLKELMYTGHDLQMWG